jgi:hypothetical protein
MKFFFSILLFIIPLQMFSQLKYFHILRQFEGVIVYKNEVISGKIESDEERLNIPKTLDSLKYYYKNGNIKVIGYLNNQIESFACFRYESQMIYRLNKTNDTIIANKVEPQKAEEYHFHFKKIRLQGNSSPPDLICLLEDNISPKIEIYYDPKIFINSSLFHGNVVAKALYLDYTNSLFLKLVQDNAYYKEILTAFRIERGAVLNEEFKLLDLPVKFK